MDKLRENGAGKYHECNNCGAEISGCYNSYFTVTHIHISYVKGGAENGFNLSFCNEKCMKQYMDKNLHID